MLDLIQNISGSDYSILRRLDAFDLTIDIKEIYSDVDKLKLALSNVENSKNRTNIKQIIRYLEDMAKRVSADGNVRMQWDVIDGMAISKPFNLIKIEEYKIDSCNYIEVNEDKIVELDFKVMADIMAFDMVHTDMGYDFDCIEDLLRDKSLIGVLSSSVLMDFFASEGLHPYKDAKEYLQIEKSSYCYPDDKVIRGYFIKRKFSYKKDNRYRSVAMCSCKEALTIIASNIVESMLKSRVPNKLLYVGDDSLIFEMSEVDSHKMNDIVDKITLRSFGRVFDVTPGIKIY